MAQSYENLRIWQEATDLAGLIYKTTNKFPKNELFGIISQIRRAVVSISANIAEGSGRGSKKDFCRFVDIAIGSLNETESLLAVSLRLEYISKEDFENLTEKIKNLGNLLGGLRRHLTKDNSQLMKSWAK